MKKKHDEETYPPIYVQASDPSKSLLKWMKKMAKKHTIYFQSGKPPDPLCGTPGHPPCP